MKLYVKITLLLLFFSVAIFSSNECKAVTWNNINNSNAAGNSIWRDASTELINKVNSFSLFHYNNTYTDTPSSATSGPRKVTSNGIEYIYFDPTIRTDQKANIYNVGFYDGKSVGLEITVKYPDNNSNSYSVSNSVTLSGNDFLTFLFASTYIDVTYRYFESDSAEKEPMYISGYLHVNNLAGQEVFSIDNIMERIISNQPRTGTNNYVQTSNDYNGSQLAFRSSATSSASFSNIVEFTFLYLNKNEISFRYKAHSSNNPGTTFKLDGNTEAKSEIPDPENISNIFNKYNDLNEFWFGTYLIIPYIQTDKRYSFAYELYDPDLEGNSSNISLSENYVVYDEENKDCTNDFSISSIDGGKKITPKDYKADKYYNRSFKVFRKITILSSIADTTDLPSIDGKGKYMIYKGAAKTFSSLGTVYDSVELRSAVNFQVTMNYKNFVVENNKLLDKGIVYGTLNETLGTIRKRIPNVNDATITKYLNNQNYTDETQVTFSTIDATSEFNVNFNIITKDNQSTFNTNVNKELPIDFSWTSDLSLKSETNYRIVAISDDKEISLNNGIGQLEGTKSGNISNSILPKELFSSEGEKKLKIRIYINDEHWGEIVKESDYFTVNVILTANITINFVNENDELLSDKIVLEKPVGSVIDLTKEENIEKSIEKLVKEKYTLYKRPEDETQILVEKEGVQKKYIFRGTLSIDSAPTNIDFGDKNISNFSNKYSEVNTDKDLVIRDTRTTLTPWKLTLKVDKPLTLIGNERYTLPYALRYRTQNGEIVLSEDSQTVFSFKLTSRGNYNLSEEEWYQKKEGLFLNIPKNSVTKSGSYKTTLLWQLEDTY